ncbi:hypothetical protein BJ912DRAFT_1054621 [Pholiota molesta]|nr:hypothetical protein BJ912DRAFT_1054621 [Pholiota molesta]
MADTEFTGLKHLRTPRNASTHRLPVLHVQPIEPLRFNVPVPQAPPIPPNPNLPDPFGPPNPPPPQPINFGGHQYTHLPANLRAMMAAVPPAPAVRNRQAAVPAPAAPAPNPPQHRRNRNAPPIGPQPFPMPPPNLPNAPVPIAMPPPPVPPVLRRQHRRVNNMEQIARQPFSNAQPVHYAEKLDVKCDHCGALHWLDERLSKSTRASPKFGMCCFSGKIKLPKLEEPPPS